MYCVNAASYTSTVYCMIIFTISITVTYNWDFYAAFINSVIMKFIYSAYLCPSVICTHVCLGDIFLYFLYIWSAARYLWRIMYRKRRSGFAAVQGHESSSMWRLHTRARIFKRLRNRFQGVDSASVCSQAAGTNTLFFVLAFQAATWAGGVDSLK